MPLDALNAVMNAEKNADARLAAAAAEARKLLAEAEAEGRQILLAAEAKAEEAVEALMVESQRRSVEATGHVSTRTAQECETLRRAAHDRIPDAVRLVVERIVNG